MSNQAKNNIPTKVVTGIARLSYANVWEPKSINGGAEKYSVSIIIPKSDTKTLSAIERAIDAAIDAGKGKFGGKIPSKASLKTPLRDGDIDRPDDPAYADSYFINASNREKPGVVDRKRIPITDPLTIYSGCYIRASVIIYPFNTNGNKGLAASLENIQFWADGEPLNGRVRAEDEFGALDDVDDEDFLD